MRTYYCAVIEKQDGYGGIYYVTGVYTVPKGIVIRTVRANNVKEARRKLYD